MMEWSYLYLVVPPAAAVCAAVVASRVIKRSSANVDRLQAEYDRQEDRERLLLREKVAALEINAGRISMEHGLYPIGGGGPAYAGGSEMVHIGPKDATRHG